MAQTFLIGWLPIAVVAYALHASAIILDKFLLAQKIQRPSTYAFWVAAWGLGAFVLAPFGFFMPDNAVIVNAFVSGAAFTFALFFFYKAIQLGEASRIAPVIGGLSPIFVLILSGSFLGETLSGAEIVAFLVLTAGSVLISATHRVDGEANNGGLHNLGLAAIAAFLFGVTYVFEKAVFNETPFINGFIWTRLGGFIGALPFLVIGVSRESIFEAPRLADRATIAAFLVNKAFGAFGFFLLSFAVSLAPSVSLVNAAQSVQYALVFVLALIFTRFRPAFFAEETSPLVIFEKAAGIALIAGGLALLAFE